MTPEHAWTTKAGLPALVRINPFGYRCGYVAVSSSPLLSTLTETYYLNYVLELSPNLDPLYNAFNEISVHGGVSFNDSIDGIRYIGFDCARSDDAPIPEFTPKYLVPYVSDGTVRSLDYCIDHCESLAEQLVAIDRKFSHLLDEFPEDFI